MAMILRLLIVLLVNSYGLAEVYKLGENGNQYTVEIYQDNNVVFDCGTNAIHVDELPHSEVSVISELTIQNCELPKESLQDVIEALGTNYTRTIKLISVSLLKREHLAHGSAESIYITNSSVATNAFEQQSQLKIININICKVNLTETFFDGLISLKFLVLIGCQIPRIPQGIFKTTPKLEQLHLTKNLITELTNSNFEGLTSLKTLFLNENKLESIPDNFLLFLPSLMRLYLDSNPLKELSINTLKGSRLIQLSIKDNAVPLRLAPRALADMPLLEFVVLINCSLTTLPEDLLENSNYIYGVHLSYNHIKVIPKNFFKNKSNLQDLNLSNNRLTESSLETLVHLTNLRILNLDENFITELTAGRLLSMNKLIHLSLRNSGLRVVSHDALPASLYYINLENNELTTLEMTVIPELRYLHLNNNSLSSLPSLWRDTFPKLVYLHLAFNSITQLTKSDFAAVPYCKMMNLTGNPIVSIEVSRNTTLPKTVSLTDTSLRCDCHLHAFATLFKNNLANNITVCAEPASLKGRRLLNVEYEELTCPSESCPHNCTCVIRPETTALEVQCRGQLTAEQFTELEKFRQQHYSDLTQKTSVTYDV